ncbi:MAG TPA: DUF2282 domain-containing protein, partial [Methylomirabilota bacterium]|nr:DUF2282 domain-containing protein [Methylomirabilota bacterium]
MAIGGRPPARSGTRPRQPPTTRRSHLNGTRLIVASAVAAALALPYATAAQGRSAPKPKFEAEKCYGLVKAGKNVCQTASSSCAGTSRRDDQGEA